MELRCDWSAPRSIDTTTSATCDWFWSSQTISCVLPAFFAVMRILFGPIMLTSAISGCPTLTCLYGRDVVITVLLLTVRRICPSLERPSAIIPPRPADEVGEVVGVLPPLLREGCVVVVPSSCPTVPPTTIASD